MASLLTWLPFPWRPGFALALAVLVLSLVLRPRRLVRTLRWLAVGTVAVVEFTTRLLLLGEYLVTCRARRRGGAVPVMLTSASSMLDRTIREPSAALVDGSSVRPAIGRRFLGLLLALVLIPPALWVVGHAAGRRSPVG
jgi:hypothetical protein